MLFQLFRRKLVFLPLGIVILPTKLSYRPPPPSPRRMNMHFSRCGPARPMYHQSYGVLGNLGAALNALGRLGTFKGTSREVLEASWMHPKAGLEVNLRRRLRRQKLLKTLEHLPKILPKSFQNRSLEAYGRVLGASGAVLVGLGSILGASWGVLGASWAVCSASWGVLGASCA